jgi:hypothetical protein
MHPSPSMTVMGGQDDAVAASARVAPRPSSPAAARPPANQDEPRLAKADAAGVASGLPK